MASLLSLVTRAAPALAKQLPRLWPLLLESDNRRRVAGVARDLADRSPARRLRGRIDLTATLASQVSEKADTMEERVAAEDWSRRARHLGVRLQMPVEGREAKKAHRETIRHQLDALQEEMNEALEG